MATTLTNKDNLDKLKKEYKQIEETRNKREGYTNISGLKVFNKLQLKVKNLRKILNFSKCSKLCCSMRDDDRTPVLNHIKQNAKLLIIIFH